MLKGVKQTENFASVTSRPIISVQCRYPKYILYVACAGAAVGAFGLFIRLYKLYI